MLRNENSKRYNYILKDVVFISDIIKNPQHYKPLKYDLAGERRVHIMKSFVLKFEVNENTKTVTFIFFGHHDEAYKR